MELYYYIVNLCSDKYYKILYGNSVKELYRKSKYWEENGWKILFPIIGIKRIFGNTDYKVAACKYKAKKFNSESVSFLYSKIEELKVEGWYVKKEVHAIDKEWYSMTMCKNINDDYMYS